MAKKIDLRKQVLILKHRMLVNAKPLRECFPNVKEIIIKTKKLPYLSVAENVINGKRVITPNDRFYVYINCINDNCINGGWNIDYELIKLINSHKKTYKSETHHCDGWRSAERVGSSYCNSEMEYEVIIDYFD